MQGKDAPQSMEEPSKVDQEESDQEELSLCFSGELHNQSLSNPSQLHVVVCFPLFCFCNIFFFFFPFC